MFLDPLEIYSNDSKKSLSSFNETTLINHIKKWLGSSNPPSPNGIGDDCAIFSAQNSGKFLISTDSLVYRKHFDSSLSPIQAGQKLVLRNLSDIAAMGGHPMYATIAIITSRNLEFEWLSDFYKGIQSIAKSYALKIIGGDLSHLEGEGFQAVMTIIGCSKNPALRNKGEVGDSIYVTGKLGGSILKKHAQFTPRILEGQWLVKNRYINSMIDLTDGLSKELKLILSPKTAASIDLNSIPISEDAKSLSDNPEKALERAISEGEDYELLFAVKNTINPQKLESQWKKEFPKIKLTKIATIVKQINKEILLINSKNNQALDLKSNFDHFKNNCD
tara:strand:- start:5727 stop:6725 length:999 start_codon:yes stop_codon:yes gene_type:complete